MPWEPPMVKALPSIRHGSQHCVRSYAMRRRASTQYWVRYGVLRAQHLPIGSGVVEAACKTLVSQRLKRAGMRWRTAGGQAILTFRALCQSDRFDRAWQLLGETYKRSVTLPRFVTALSQYR